MLTQTQKTKKQRFLGEIVVKWKQCLIYPEEYAINWEQSLQNVTYSGKKNAGSGPGAVEKEDTQKEGDEDFEEDEEGGEPTNQSKKRELTLVEGVAGI